MYKLLQSERRRFLKISYMHQEPNDVEEMVKALHNHFLIIRKTALRSRTKENSQGMGTQELLQMSN